MYSGLRAAAKASAPDYHRAPTATPQDAVSSRHAEAMQRKAAAGLRSSSRTSPPPRRELSLPQSKTTRLTQREPSSRRAAAVAGSSSKTSRPRCALSPQGKTTQRRVPSPRRAASLAQGPAPANAPQKRKAPAFAAIQKGKRPRPSLPDMPTSLASGSAPSHASSAALPATSDNGVASAHRASARAAALDPTLRARTGAIVSAEEAARDEASTSGDSETDECMVPIGGDFQAIIPELSSTESQERGDFLLSADETKADLERKNKSRSSTARGKRPITPQQAKCAREKRKALVEDALDGLFKNSTWEQVAAIPSLPNGDLC